MKKETENPKGADSKEFGSSACSAQSDFLKVTVGELMVLLAEEEKKNREARMWYAEMQCQMDRTKLRVLAKRFISL